MDKQLILKKIQEHYGFKKKVDFAHFLGITPNTLNGWMTRKTYKDHILSAKSTEINSRWISTGEGPMLQKDVESKENNQIPKEFIQQLFDERKRHDEIVLSQQKTIELLVSKIGSDNINQ